MAALGSTVTMLVRGDSLLTGYEPFAGQHVREALEAAGVTIRFGTEAVSASRPEAAGGGDVGRLHGGPVTVTVGSADGQQELSGDELLAATGRKPHLDDVGLENVGDRKSTRLNSSHVAISYAVFCLKKKKSDQLKPDAARQI